MAHVSITRLRIRSLRFLPRFLVHTTRAIRQTRQADGFITGALLRDRSLTFWTMTVWDDQQDMRRYMTSGAHRETMPFLLDWCDEASVVHWTQPGLDPPTWQEADRRMRTEGRPSKVRRPSAEHGGLAYRTPRVSASVPILRR